MKNNFNLPALALFTGVVVATSIAVVGAIIFSDKRNRDKVEEIGNNIKNKTKTFVKGIQDKAIEKKDEIEEQFSKGKEKIMKFAHKTGEILSNKAEDIQNVANIS